MSTELHKAAGRGDIARVKRLIEAGADPHARDKYDRTALFGAAGARFPDDSRAFSCVQVLLEAGADLNVRDKAGLTPLHYAATAGNLLEINLLVEAGADPRDCDRAGAKPADLAFKAETKALLRTHEHRKNADEQRQALAARLAQSSSEAPQQQQVRRRL